MQRYRVCVTDDNEDNAIILKEGLGLHGYDAVAVHTGKEALDVCCAGGIDLVLLDVCLPDISGYEVCQRLKENPKTHDIVVIFVTVKGSTEDIAHGFSLGAADWITKPYNLPIVMVRVDSAMRNKATHDQLRSQNEMLLDNAYTDHLTGLRNRRFLLERLQEEVEKAHRYDYPVSCVVFDLDEVKAVDDELGPVSLDDLLTEIGMELRNYSRTFDVLARYDGTQFAAILPHTVLDDAVGYVSKIMAELGATTFSDPNFPTKVQFSAGIVTCQNGSAHGADFVLGEAMRGLLQAKSQCGERLIARNLSEA
ncbi:MAG: diguanylate cyclase [Candidatus Hydrogenedentes bacterium]|nr:diguanylate cyclase [Candidatus Hydrogenedentota bacterium]